MGRDVNGAEPNDGCADGEEDEDNKEGEGDSEEFAAAGDLGILPVDVLRRRHFLALDVKLLPFEEILLLELLDTTAAKGAGAAMAAAREEVVFVEV
jgi:hypothetical protein